MVRGPVDAAVAFGPFVSGGRLMSARPWLRYPARTVRPRPCPSGLPRFASRRLAMSSVPLAAGVTPTVIDCAVCGGVHVTDPIEAGPR
jgi:hypothetical protein